MPDHSTHDPGPDVLADPLLTIRAGPSTGRITLAALIARLLTGPEIDGFPHLAAEQRGYWWRFLVRCGARALRSIGDDVPAACVRDPDGLAAAVEDALRQAAPEGAWLLHQPDPARAGFLQPPTPDGEAPEKGYKQDSLRLLTGVLGMKNHERKYDVGRRRTAEETVYALAEYQSACIYGGRGHYESQFMGSKSGAGSGTPFMGAWLGGHVETFRHDVQVLLDRWDVIREENGLRGDVWALWAERWDGKTPLPASKLDPAFIPLARMIRLAPPDPDGRFTTLWFKTSKGSRVDDHTEGGALGDPFTPLVPHPKTGDPKVRGTLAKGYDYAEVVRLLFGGGNPGTPSPSVAALVDRADDEQADVWVRFEGTAYEQGKTVGFHRRVVPLPTTGRLFLGDPDPVREAHTEMTGYVKDAKSALRGAARILLAGSPRPREGDAGKVEAPAAALEARVDAVYVLRLLDAAERLRAGDDGWVADWCRELRSLALQSFWETADAIPTRTVSRYRDRVEAEAYLWRKLRDALDLPAREDDSPADEELQPAAVDLNEESTP